MNGKKFKCEDCGYVYVPEEGDLDNGIDPETEFEDLPEDWECPMCGAPKAIFVEDDED
jgi:rubredoxin